MDPIARKPAGGTGPTNHTSRAAREEHVEVPAESRGVAEAPPVGVYPRPVNVVAEVAARAIGATATRSFESAGPGSHAATLALLAGSRRGADGIVMGQVLDAHPANIGTFGKGYLHLDTDV